MSAVKTLACSLAAWTSLGLVSARADAISRGAAERLWSMILSGGSVSAAQAITATPAAPAPAVVAPPTPVPTPAASPAPVASTGFTPMFAGAASASSAIPAAASVMAPAPASDGSPAPSIPSTAAAAGPIVASPSPAPGTVNAFINMTAGPYPSASGLTTGNAQPWYDSPSVIQAFGGVPNAQQQASFVQTVLQDVQHTYALSGMDPTLTTNPNVPAQHTISVASGLSYAANPQAIGITDVGGNGFSFIDKLDYANNPTDLAWAVAHNVSHELMHAFGIGYHPDGGNYVDAGTANWSTLTDPNTQFGPAATQLLLASQYGALSTVNGPSGVGAELLNPEGTTVDGDEVVATPEPATMAMWAVGALGGLWMLRRRGSRPSA